VKTVMGVLVAVMIVSASSAAHGSPSADEFRQRVVNYSDLNLSDRADAVRLYRRITHAAHLVCVLPNPWDVSTETRVHTCIHAARARSVEDVNSPELTRYYESRERTPAVVVMRSREP
jgi:UrcA family protein